MRFGGAWSERVWLCLSGQRESLQSFKPNLTKVHPSFFFFLPKKMSHFCAPHCPKSAHGCLCGKTRGELLRSHILHFNFHVLIAVISRCSRSDRCCCGYLRDRCLSAAIQLVYSPSSRRTRLFIIPLVASSLQAVTINMQPQRRRSEFVIYNQGSPKRTPASSFQSVGIFFKKKAKLETLQQRPDGVRP